MKCKYPLQPFPLGQTNSAVTIAPISLIERQSNGGIVQSLSLPQAGFAVSSSIDSQQNQGWRFINTFPPQLQVSFRFIYPSKYSSYNLQFQGIGGGLSTVCSSINSVECRNLIQHLSGNIETLPHPLQLEFLLPIQHPLHHPDNEHPTTIYQHQSIDIRKHHHLPPLLQHSQHHHQHASFGNC